MSILNVEIKASSEDPDDLRKILESNDADFKGTDHQIDTYFEVPKGRLKLREGSIENNLIFYHRGDQAAPKASQINLVPMHSPTDMKALLTNALGIKVVVDKKREIYFIENVKFHIDEVKGLGNFVEIEAIDETGDIGEAKLREQCTYYIELLGIAEKDMIAVSYSDLIEQKES